MYSSEPCEPCPWQGLNLGRESGDTLKSRINKAVCIARRIYSRYSNLLRAVLEVRSGAYYDLALNFVEVLALIVINRDVTSCRNSIENDRKS